MQALNCMKSLDCITASEAPEILSKLPLELLCLGFIMHLLIRDYETIKSPYLAMLLSATAFSCPLLCQRSPKPLEITEGNFPFGFVSWLISYTAVRLYFHHFRKGTNMQ